MIASRKCVTTDPSRRLRVSPLFESVLVIRQAGSARGSAEPCRRAVAVLVLSAPGMSYEPSLRPGRVLSSGPVRGSKRAHLALVRSLVRRMRLSSAMLKAWSLMMALALLAVASDPRYARFGWIPVFMTIAFWMIDAQFQRQARLFRKIHDRAVETDESDLDFSLDTGPVDNDEDAWLSVLLSRALAPYYGSVIVASAIVRWLRPF
jgi:hypothetical protein